MIKKLLTISFFILLFVPPMWAQHTVGLLSYQPAKTYDGYNLIYPHNQPNVYLLNNCGEIVHVWEDDAGFRPGNTAYLLPDGKIVKAKRPAAVAGDPIWAGGGGAIVEIRDWDNNLEWSFELNNDQARLHHDIAVTEKGTILMIVWEVISLEEAAAAGRDTSLLAEGELWPDYIIEVDPATDEIIWEWHVWDHLIQDFDDTKANFGVVADHPELVDVNWDTTNGDADWMHSNALDYNDEQKQIMLSVPTFNEVWLIDHTTTTQEAASHNGGFGGRGGDLLYRWGNPATYGRGTADDQKNFYQHDTHWIDDFLEPTHPHYNKIAIFNNRVGTDFSTVNVFNPPWDMYNWIYNINAGEAWGPTNFDLTLTHPEPTQLYSTGLSSVQFLPNGNTLICSGRFGYAFELTPDKEIAWEYKTPLLGGNPVSQGDTLQINNNLTFRLKRFPTDYAAFDGRDLSSKGWIELNPDSTFCDKILPTSNVMKEYFLKIHPNPASDQLTIEWEGGLYANVEIFDLMGRKMDSFKATGGRKYLNISDWQAGIYFVQIEGREVQKLVVSR